MGLSQGCRWCTLDRLPAGTLGSQIESRESPLPEKPTAEKLSIGTWTHDFPIWANVGKELGLPINTDMPSEVLELMTLYSQPVRTQGGGVEYLPVPRQKDGPRQQP